MQGYELSKLRPLLDKVLTYFEACIWQGVHWCGTLASGKVFIGAGIDGDEVVHDEIPEVAPRYC